MSAGIKIECRDCGHSNVIVGPEPAFVPGEWQCPNCLCTFAYCVTVAYDAADLVVRDHIELGTTAVVPSVYRRRF